MLRLFRACLLFAFYPFILPVLSLWSSFLRPTLSSCFSFCPDCKRLRVPFALAGLLRFRASDAREGEDQKRRGACIAAFFLQDRTEIFLMDRVADKKKKKRKTRETNFSGAVDDFSGV